jgi:hypothetical protein
MAKKPTMKDKKGMMKEKMPANGLTAAQKKLPAGLQAAIMKKKKK